MTSTTAASGLADHRSPAIAPAAVPDDDPISVAVPFTPLNVLIAVPTLHAGAADAGAVELVRILASGGHRVFVASGGGRLADAAEAAGARCLSLDLASRNPIRMLRNVMALRRIVREQRCDVLHAHGRAPAWCALLAARLTGVPFLTTWYKGFREQNALKRLYNGVMARGDRVIAVSDQLAELINDRYGTPFSRIAVIPLAIDTAHFDPDRIEPARVAALRRAWGVADTDRVILVVGRMLRRKGHDLVVKAGRRLKAMGLKDFVFVFAAEEHATRYAAELWDEVLASDTSDVIRTAGPIDDLPAAYAASMAALSAAVQPEGLQRALLEAQAMARPVIVSDLGAGADVVLAQPAVGNDRATGIRFATGDESALTAVLIRLLSMSASERRAMGGRGRAWVASHFSAQAATTPILQLYAEVAIKG